MNRRQRCDPVAVCNVIALLGLLLFFLSELYLRFRG